MNNIDLLCRHAEYGGARTSRAAGGDFDVFFVFLSVTLLNGRVVLKTSPSRRLHMKTLLVSLGRGSCVVVHPRLSLSLHR